MTHSLRLRSLTEADLPFANQVRALAGWNQTRADWKRFLATQPDGCFLGEWEGQPAGTATTTVYGLELAWIGMVLVHPAYRRRGIGRALLDHCLEFLQGRGVRDIKLDATPAGKQVYDLLGFKDEWTLHRWVRLAALAPMSRAQPSLRPWNDADAALAGALDATAFGVSRERFLRTLATQSEVALAFEAQPGRLAGYGLLRAGAQALYLGPVAAMSSHAGHALLEALLARAGGRPVMWDIPDQNATAVAWGEQQGFTRQRPLIRMVLGENRVPGDPQQQFALAGPETG